MRRKSLLISGVVFAAVLAILFIPMQSSAFMIQIYTPPATSKAGSTLYIPLQVIISKQEVVPIDSVKLTISGPNGYHVSCTLPLKDGEVVKCKDVTVKAAFSGQVEKGTPPAGAKYWYSYETQKVLVGYGYGYSGTYPIYETRTVVVRHTATSGFYPVVINSAGFLQYLLYWSTPSQPGTYTITLTISVDGHTYSKTKTVTLS